ncbi:hypothetical protein [Phenylobacterium sp.]|uniref:hypothetical protein n=1 Tax=Phenylobacterium sp. TaxID=1871053 RepID=UPI0025F76D91|nr:hypothetical protein [Phenylobacterium sp.]MBX3483828.1 hypothetical protein [Phenylobacterium sp.]MCW5760857.1 hypothetical protein [Phenylobacterium sp.]
MSARLITLALAAAVALPAQAQLLGKKRVAGPPEGAPITEVEAWPYPAPEPEGWWDDKRPKVPEEADPLGGRRIRSVEQLVKPDNGVEASTYRLWGLMPLQWQLVRGDEMILEVWTRPSNSVRQTVTRVTVRSDGDVFVQARAGLACCEAGIGRRMGFDRRLPPGSAARFQALKTVPVWASPRDVRVVEAGAAEAVCVEGTAYDITLVTPGRSTTLHRACDPAEVGEAADVLEPVLAAALGHDPRFDVLFRGGASFAGARSAYRDLLASNGRLTPNPDARQPPPGQEGAPPAENEAGTPSSGTTPPAPESLPGPASPPP